MNDVPNFNTQSGLVAAVVQDSRTKRVLMVGYMNREAFDTTLSTGHVTFFSRSRQRLWTKGETSGHYLLLRSVASDCDGDALLIEAEPLGPGVCHNGYQSCFYRKLENGRWVEAEEKAYDPEAVYGVQP
jgi:phosphoribosyl-AMP cyclohydrolase